MSIKVEEGGADNVNNVFGLFKGSFGLSNSYLVVFGLYLPKTEGKIENTHRK